MLKAGAGAPGRALGLSRHRDRTAVEIRQAVFRLPAGSAKIARAGLPQIIPVTEFRDVFGVAMTNTLGGADVAAELKKATETFAPVLAKSEQG
jgi:multiple sugar transport system substrate-binding protein